MGLLGGECWRGGEEGGEAEEEKKEKGKGKGKEERKRIKKRRAKKEEKKNKNKGREGGILRDTEKDWGERIIWIQGTGRYPLERRTNYIHLFICLLSTGEYAIGDKE